jgi:hypothetical protein
MRLLLLQVLLFTVVARSPTAVHAWRKEGHYMVCKIAEVTLTERALDECFFITWLVAPAVIYRRPRR